jgi:hypothetical protein
MFSSIFSFLYELVCGQNSDSPEYEESIFGSVGLITLLIAIVVCLIFYCALGRWKNVWHNLTHWIITLVIVAIIGFGLAYGIADNEIGSVNGYLIKFAIFNAVYITLYFVIFSFLFKNFSIYSKRTPI